MKSKTNKEKFLELISDEEVKTIQQLKQLAAKIREENKTVEKSLKTLQDAGILDKQGNFTEHYKNLEDMKESYSEFEFVENSSISSAPATSTSAITAHNSTDETLVTDKHVLAVIQQLKDRSIAGQKKYNTNLEREDLSIQDWLQHAQEETLDFANYLQVLKEKFKDII